MNPNLQSLINSALKCAIDAHGPITHENYGSASKRIAGQLATMFEVGEASPQEQQAHLLVVAIGNQCLTLLPSLDLCGWAGYADGFMSYIDWRARRDLPVALMDLAASKSRAHIGKTRQDIIDVFYGGDSKYREFSKAMFKSISWPFGNNSTTPHAQDPLESPASQEV